MKQYTFKINGNSYDVAINSISGNIADVTVNGTSYQVELDNTPTSPVQASPVRTADMPVPSVAPKVSSPSASSAPAAAVSGAGKTVNSPLPGVIVSVNVTAGDSVKAGQVVAVLEAMKMENEIQAESDGIITAVNVAKGDSVLEGTAIVTIG